MKSLEDRMVSGNPVEMLQAQREFLAKVRKSQEETLQKIDEAEKRILAQIEKLKLTNAQSGVGY